MRRWILSAVLVFTASTLAAEPPKPDDREKSADKGEKMICKRFTETGSLVRARRVCKTKRDWEREREAIRSMTNSSGSCAGQGLSGGC
ncbi:hypothetical protein HNO88_000956 [Novosphingobium chloroacetimidivorans]|uniref:Secreted protein n=1 Tax=Novosphingobium chloroacetimidivorans TaxID=1428314 RepID=A0A7W7NW07_9SPHN|nr:hypothetical protein [Novosphingobium chloroacetimidivorans]MBB4857645.1 hypothetical protein [Novosphingobium chloroacetimidivorans]